VVMIGGSGADTMIGGSGGDTMTGGGGANVFAFFASATDGAQVFITDFNASDSVDLGGYDPAQSAISIQDAATVSSAGVTLTLSDQTTITFAGLTSASALNGHILYAG
jgi:Ca2+-binding RTX toxin-like protein